MKKLAGLGTLTVLALAAPVLALLAMLGLAGNAIACTTVSTPRLLSTLPMTGLRMSARTKDTLPRSCRGGLT